MSLTDRIGDLNLKSRAAKTAEALSSWMYLLPLAAIGGVIWYAGFRWVFAAAFIAGIVGWNYWGSKMAISDPKLVLAVDVEKSEISPLMIGRRRYASAEKKGLPYLNFRTPSGLFVEVVKSYDEDANLITFPDGDIRYNDLMIAAIPRRYGELIDEFVSLETELLKHKSEASVEAFKIARKHIADFSALMTEIMTPPESVTEKAVKEEGKDAGV
ncbi:hypothetical protein AOA81_06620 [Methanomassiliicoccales archaeon RumEn M2]|nr:hypothetical protein AOA81_06620 [Methanomassiliicoccales archaeon RumEn M2]